MSHKCTMKENIMTEADASTETASDTDRETHAARSR